MKKRKYKLWDIFYIMSAHSISTLRSCRVENCPMSHNMSQANPFFKDCWPVWCTPCARNFPMVQPSIVYWISQNLTQSNLMYPNIQYVTHSIKREIFISV